LAQNALAKNASSVKQSLYDPAKNIEQYFKTKKPRSYKSIYLRDNDQKNTLMLSKVHARNEILEQALIIQLKVHNGMHFNHTPAPFTRMAFCTYLMFSV